MAKPSSRLLPQKQGLQSLGKVPTARKAPTNLPSLRAESAAKAAAEGPSAAPSEGHSKGKPIM